jgi:sugar lactone lactonase YvrE
MVFGRKKEASEETATPWTRVTPPRPHVNGMFRQPTDVTWDPDGDVFISDGYVNSRVAKFDRHGDWVKSWGEKGSRAGEFDTPHSIAADARGNVYVADRGNRRIQVFSADGVYQRSISVTHVPVPANAKPAIGDPIPAEATGTQSPGAPWTVCITPGPNQVLFTSDSYPGRIYKLSLDGTLLGILGTSGKQAKQFGWIHEIACPSEHELYVAELLNWRVQKLTLR